MSTPRRWLVLIKLNKTIDVKNAKEVDWLKNLDSAMRSEFTIYSQLESSFSVLVAAGVSAKSAQDLYRSIASNGRLMSGDTLSVIEMSGAADTSNKSLSQFLASSALLGQKPITSESSHANPK